MDDKRQIAATFAVSCTGEFLPIQLIYAGKTEWSLPKYSFHSSFSEGSQKINDQTRSNLLNFLKKWCFLIWKTPMLKYHPNYSTDVEISSKLLDLKPIHARWIDDWYNHVIKEKEMIVRGFNSAGISEAVQKAEDIYEKTENPFSFLSLLNC